MIWTSRGITQGAEGLLFLFSSSSFVLQAVGAELSSPFRDFILPPTHHYECSTSISIKAVCHANGKVGSLKQIVQENKLLFQDFATRAGGAEGG